jgi:hypothetical protein
VACATKKHFERVVIFLILLRKIKKMTTRSLFYFAAGGGEYLLRQARREFFCARRACRPAVRLPRGQAVPAKRWVGFFETASILHYWF